MPARRHDSQKDMTMAGVVTATPQRLRNNLTAARQTPQQAIRTRPFARLQLDVSGIRRRTP
jgi:hypothetical protein